MKYTLTPDLTTGNALIDSQHRLLLDTVNTLMDACSSRKGREQIQSTLTFLNDYVAKHFRDEERLQMQTSYPGYPEHKKFHEGYRQMLAETSQQLVKDGSTIKALGELNRIVAILVAHIRNEDKRLAHHIQSM